MTTYLLFTHPHYGETVTAYTAAEMAETFGEVGSAKLAEGEVIFAAGGLWVNMVVAARKVTEDHLEG